MLENFEEKTDAELVSLATQEQAAFTVLISRYESKLRRYIKRLGIHNNEDQLDVLQNIFIKVYRNLNSFDAKLSFSSWIYRIAHNEAISWYRHHSVRPEGHMVAKPEEVIGLLASGIDSPEREFDREIEAEEVNEALQQIDNKYRQVLILRFFEEKEYEEISDILKIPLGSVGTLIYRGKKQLYNVLNQQLLRSK